MVILYVNIFLIFTFFQIHYHRRTESFDLGKNYIHQNRTTTCVEKKGGSNGSGGSGNGIPPSGRSPILQKNIGYQNLKAIECKIRFISFIWDAG